MSEITSPRWYRQFQKLALVLGAVVAVIGLVTASSTVFGAGAIVLLHALIASVVLLVEDRRSISEPDQSTKK